MKHTLPYLIGLLITFNGFGQQSWEGDTVRNESNGSAYTDYYLHVPPNPSGDVGLIVFLHGNGPSRNISPDEGIKRLVDEGMTLAMRSTNVFNNYENDYYVLVPHHNAAAQGQGIEGEWIIPELKAFIDGKISDWNIDEGDDFPAVDMNRIVVVGFSLGGKAAWDLAEAYPDFAAGVMPTWGSALPNNVDGVDWCNMDDLPIWAINGEEDGIFPVDGTSSSLREGVNLIESTILGCNPNAPFNKTLLTGRNHFGWNELFKLEMGIDVYDWMTSLTKGTTDYAPVVSVGDDKKILSNTDQYVVYGFALDYLNESFTRIWDVQDITASLSTPTFSVADETSDYVFIQGLEEGHTYLISLTVNDGTTIVTDEMELFVENFSTYSGPEVTNIRIAGGPSIISFPTDDIVDKSIIDKQNFNILAESPSGTTIRSELNEQRRYNFGGGPNFDYQDNLFGFGGANLQLFDDDLRRLTFTMNLFTGNTYHATFQATAQFTNDPDALPITLLSFTGKVADQGVRLDWSTTEEEGNSHFEIYRGRSGDDLVKIGETAKAPPGNLYNYYSFTDREARDGIYYYQLQSVDYDGHRDISEIIRIALTPGEEFQVYPNPAVNGQFTITYSADNDQRPVLFNSRGQQVDFTLAASPNGPGEQQVILNNALPGMYMLQVWHKGQPQTRKVLVE